MEEQIKIVKGNITGEDSTYIRRGTGNIEFDSNTHKILLDGVNYSGDTLIETTYSELRDLRDNKQLIPGCWYRITDYTCTTTQENTRAVHNNFDIIVLALSNDTLSEEARAIMHQESQSEIEAQIEGFKISSVRFNDSVSKTCYIYTENSGNTWNFIDVDTLLGIYGINRSDIYFYPDPFDPVQVDSHSSEDLVTKYGYFSNSKLEAWKIWYCLENNKVKYSWADTTNGKGVIYRMIDEWGNDVCYDFKNIQFKRKLTNGEYDPDNGEDTWVYTFNIIIDEICQDASVVGNSLQSYENGNVVGVYNNKIGILTEGDSFQPDTFTIGSLACWLNNNVFLTISDDNYYQGCSNNILISDCHSNTFMDNCHTNILGMATNNNIFKARCKNNKLGDFCNNNVFGTNCYNNVFGNYFANNKLENGCYDNTFKDKCEGNILNNTCFNNTFSEHCCNNTLGSANTFNSLENDCGNITTSSNCSSNRFHNNCNNIIIGSYCIGNQFGNACNHIKFGSSSTTKNRYYYIIIDGGNKYIYLNTDQTTDSSNVIRNITIAQGVNNTNTYKTIIHTTVNDNFQTVYRPANSQIVSV